MYYEYKNIGKSPTRCEQLIALCVVVLIFPFVLCLMTCLMLMVHRTVSGKTMNEKIGKTLFTAKPYFT